MASQRIESIISIGGNDEESKKKMTREVRGALPTSIEWMIMAWVLGLCDKYFYIFGRNRKQHNYYTYFTIHNLESENLKNIFISLKM